MESVILHIANHFLSIEGDNESRLLRTMSGFPVFMFDEDVPEPDWRVRCGVDFVVPTQRTLLYEFDFEEGNYHCEFFRADGVYYFTMNTFVFRYDPSCHNRIDFAGENSMETSAAPDSTVLRFALWFATSIFLASCKATLIHSSVVVSEGGAVLFLGESGTGKSTHTRLWLQHIPGARLLNDDSPILAVEDGVPVIYGSPWSGKTHCYHKRQFPLKAVVRLSQAPENRMRRLGNIEAFASLQPSCPPALAYDDYFSDRVIDMISDVIQSVPVYHLACLPNAEAALLSHNTIFGQ